MRTFPQRLWPAADEIYALSRRFADAGGRRVLVSEATAELVAHALRRFADEMNRPAEFEHGLFRVEVVGPYPVDKIQVVSRDREIVDAAFEIMIRKNPGAKVMLLHSSRVLRSHESANSHGAGTAGGDGAA